jgi:type I restriction enzyme S subunit
MMDLITEHIATWSGAEIPKTNGGRGRGRGGNGQSPHGIKKLRELILELAVRGKLVPQDPKDEPASVLLEKIAKEKVRLVKDDKIKKQKLLPKITEDEKPFELPKKWEWTRLGTITQINPRNDADDELSVSFVPMPLITTSHSGEHGQEIKTWGEIKKGYTHFADGDIGVAKITPCFENSKAVVFSELENGIGAGTTELHIARPFNTTLLAPRYILLFLKAPMFLIVGETKMTGTAGQKRVPKEFFSESPLPLPPLAEQQRIVAKVDELMALCDKLEQQQTAGNATHQILVETLLATLTTCTDQAEFALSWQRIAAHFDTLFTTEKSIDQLKQTILQLAVMGKLVPQDPNDEPASVLLEKIAKEKAQLIKEGKIKKQKPLPKIGDDEKPFLLPKGWEWVRFFVPNTVRSELVSAKDFPEEKQIAPDSIEKDTGNLLFHRTVAESGASGPNNRFHEGQILYSKIRPSLNKVVVAPYDGLCSADMYPIVCHINTVFMLNVILSEVFLAQVRLAENRVKMPKLNLESLGQLVVPLAPLSEQRRIVAKVDELIALCNTLKEGLHDAQTTQVQLADAIIEQAVA